MNEWALDLVVERRAWLDELRRCGDVFLEFARWHNWRMALCLRCSRCIMGQRGMIEIQEGMGGIIELHHRRHL